MTSVKVSILDLTVDQVEQLETELGAPVDTWGELPSRMRVYRRIYAIATGVDQASVGAMTMRDLTDLVELGDAADDGGNGVTEAGNPTDQPNG